MRRFLIIPVMILMTSISINAADWRGEFCSQDKKVCLILEQNESLLDVFFQNKFSPAGAVSTATFEVKGEMENLRSPVSFPITRVFRGGDPVKVVTLTVADTTKRWNTNMNYNWTFGAPKGKADRDVVYLLPHEKGKRIRIMQGFNGASTHKGEFSYAIDWQMPVGTPVYAAREGIVTDVEDRFAEGKFHPAYLNKTNYVFIQHSDGSVGRYCHMVKGGVKVRPGQSVLAGDIIALSGNSGYSGGPHLHLDVYHPLDGKRRETVPIMFKTAFSDSETLLEGNFYYHSDGAMKAIRPKIETDDIVLCRKIDKHLPSGIGNSFPKGKDILLYIPFFTTGEYDLKTVFYRGTDPTGGMVSAWRTKKDWWYAYSTLKTNKLPAPVGAWKADVYVDGTLLRSLEFSITP